MCTSAINLRNIMEAIMEEKFELWDKLLILELNDIFSSIQKKKMVRGSISYKKL